MSGTAALTSLRSILHATDSPCFLPLPKRMREEPLGGGVVEIVVKEVAVGRWALSRPEVLVC
jgi:hypothetical protein